MEVHEWKKVEVIRGCIFVNIDSHVEYPLHIEKGLQEVIKVYNMGVGCKDDDVD